jgi:signal peptidase I
MTETEFEDEVISIPEYEEEPISIRRTTFLKEVLETILWVIILYFIVDYVSIRVLVKGRSMEPNLVEGNFLLVNKLAYQNGLPDRGEIIVFNNPLDEEIDFIKRVIGLPGDTIEVTSGDLYLNGTKIEEYYIYGDSLRNTPLTSVPDGHVYVMGDNRNVSSDSRMWGPLNTAAILGQPVLIYWPPSDWGSMPHSTETFP